MTHSLDIQARAASESAESLRARGVVPAVYYGPTQAPVSISVDARKLEALWKTAGETTIITLNGDGASKDTLIHDVQFHPVTGQLLHADFYVLEKGKKVEISVPLEFVGAAPAEKAGCFISKALHEVEIEVAPQDIPHTLTVDLTLLVQPGDHIVASQIKLPASATLVTHADEIVASATEQQEEEASLAPAAEAPKTA